MSDDERPDQTAPHPGEASPETGAVSASRSTAASTTRSAGEKTERVKRQAPISWRPPEEKRARFEDMVAASGLSNNAFITEAVFGRTRHRPAELKLLAQILAREAQLADEIRAIRGLGGPTVDAEILALIAEAQAEIRSCLFSLMGRRP